ncbi:MAG: hypothetical protein KatS3mg082_1833 [Nitrospiraceae bacterium]|nr:MAG: hypothetical protein KatS3mg082_1833 [Nitrospiraceae bacterium]
MPRARRSTRACVRVASSRMAGDGRAEWRRSTERAADRPLRRDVRDVGKRKKPKMDPSPWKPGSCRSLSEVPFRASGRTAPNQTAWARRACRGIVSIVAGVAIGDHTADDRLRPFHQPPHGLVGQMLRNRFVLWGRRRTPSRYDRESSPWSRASADSGRVLPDAAATSQSCSRRSRPVRGRLPPGHGGEACVRLPRRDGFLFGTPQGALQRAEDHVVDVGIGNRDVR